VNSNATTEMVFVRLFNVGVGSESGQTFRDDPGFRVVADVRTHDRPVFLDVTLPEQGGFYDLGACDRDHNRT
jgi:hypothetical protein